MSTTPQTPAPRNTSWGGTRRSYPPPIRRAILERDNYTCQIQGPDCTGVATEADHVLPWSQGGQDTIDNGQAVCPTCHRHKTERERAHGRAKHSRYRTPPQHPAL